MTRFRREFGVFGSFCSVFAFGWTLAAAAATPPSCSDMVSHHINAFYADPMESMGADDTLKNPCTELLEVVPIEFKPGLGFVQRFENGDIYAESDPYVIIICTDGRALLKNAETNVVYCDSR